MRAVESGEILMSVPAHAIWLVLKAGGNIFAVCVCVVFVIIAASCYICAAKIFTFDAKRIRLTQNVEKMSCAIPFTVYSTVICSCVSENGRHTRGYFDNGWKW